MYVSREDFRRRMLSAELERVINNYLAWLKPKTKIGEAVVEARKRGLNVRFGLRPKINPEWEKLGPEADVHFVTANGPGPGPI